jgi:predicted nucleic acid-binding Zn ribbon protein
MLRAAKVLSKMKLAKAGVSSERLAVPSWAQTVGKTIARHSRAVGIFEGTLVVDVEDAIWEKNLRLLEPQIMAKLTAVVGPGKVRNIRFKLAIPKRTAQREDNLHSADEANQIQDPILRHIYIQSRKRATA